MEKIHALLAQDVDGKSVAALRELNIGDLPDAAVTVRVEYSALNYKDSLALCGNRNKVMKSLPFIPGIDLAGEIVDSQSDQFQKGQKVVASGWGLGERHWGAYTSLARLRPEWLTPLPEGLSTRRAMALGTAGLTALLAVDALEEGGVQPSNGEILVTGATGGVGSLALSLLARRGYGAVALTGKPERQQELLSLGAKSVLPRQDLDRDPKPLEAERWAGVIDTVGGRIMASALAQIKQGGVMSACGLAANPSLPTTVLPFILRGVRLQGIDSVYIRADRRPQLWQTLHDLTREQDIDSVIHEIDLTQATEIAANMLAGRTYGRTVIRIAGEN
jgi:acrylyl-CoA reductase (NADPH)